MTKSMTAFARAEKTRDTLSVAVEIRAYNSRHLDLVLRVPQPHIALENRIKAFISDRVVRGRLDVHLQVRETVDEAYAFEVNLHKARAYHRALEQLKSSLNMDENISLDLLMGAGDIIVSAEARKNPDDYWPTIAACLAQAVSDLDAMRRQEGQFLSDDLTRRVNAIDGHMSTIKRESVDLIAYYQQRLQDRITTLTKGLVELDPHRIAQEAALLADKSDISEEIVRVNSHIEQFRKIIGSEDAAGRKLNFLVQELYREINTIGAKTGKALVSHLVVDLKSELEKIREQVQNIE